MSTLSSTAVKGQKPQTFEDYEHALRQEDSGFFVRLRAHCARFSDREMQVVMLIRLGLKTQAILNVLPIEYDSLENCRYHIRKKLGLKHGDSLYEALLAI